MHSAIVLALTIVVMPSSFNSVPIQNPSPPALRTLVQTFQTVWDAHDAGRLAELFSDDADQIMGDGPTTAGRQAIRQWWQARFASMERGRKITLTVSSARLISPDVGVINTVAVTGGRDSQGQSLPSDTDRGTWVVVNKAGQWLIAALRVYPAERASRR
jgi:uncharacterized protein (TIGR02246 family)